MSIPPRLTIAIDGPSGAGKGTVARAVARALGYRHLDTGAMYRAVGWLAIQKGVSLGDEAALTALASTAAFDLENGRVVINGHDVTTAIRTPEIDQAATSVARVSSLREVLVAQQRRIGSGRGVVVEGRDIGTVVFPDADLKIYLDASPEERARRRANDPAHASSAGSVVTVAGALAERDRIDRTRAASPLTVAPDAIVLDTTDLGVDQVVAKALALAQQRIANF
jgi:cytidylate kinase